jgi:hypothetical protein
MKQTPPVRTFYVPATTFILWILDRQVYVRQLDDALYSFAAKGIWGNRFLECACIFFIGFWKNLWEFLDGSLMFRFGHALLPFHLAFTPDARNRDPAKLGIVSSPGSERPSDHYATRSRGDITIKVFILTVDLAEDPFEQRHK